MDIIDLTTGSLDATNFVLRKNRSLLPGCEISEDTGNPRSEEHTSELQSH